MQQVIQISLSGHPTKFNLDADAYDELRQYLDRARIGLKADPDHEEVMRDLEQSIGERLADLLPADEHIINLTDMTEVLAAVGPVDTGHHCERNSARRPPPPRSNSGRARHLWRLPRAGGLCSYGRGLGAHDLFYARVSHRWRGGPRLSGNGLYSAGCAHT